MPRYGRADAISFFVRKDEVLRLSEELYVLEAEKYGAGYKILDRKSRFSRLRTARFRRKD